MLSDRQDQIFATLVREHIRTAEPVGSNRLAELFGSHFSSATIRLDLALLEEAGYLSHPHTSAGRVPTETGYRYFIAHFLPEESSYAPTRSTLRELRDMHRKREEIVRGISHTLARLTGEIAFASIGEDELFYTGIANLFAKPEFRDAAEVQAFSEVLDHIDEIIGDASRAMHSALHIFVGSDNPFGSQCGTILVRVRLAPHTSGLLGLVGPMRMDYERNVAIMSSLRDTMNELIR